jgi:hypothetical protein
MINRQTAIVSANGIEIADGSGRVLIDLAAAMASSLGHRDAAVVDAILQAAGSNLGSGFDVIGPSDLRTLGEPFDSFAAIAITPSVSEANERVIRIARQAGQLRDRGTGNGGTTDRFRIITLLGGVHGDTLACRSAGGRIDDQAALLPLAAGFRHVAPGDTRALEKAIDAQTIAVMLSPVDWTRGGEPFDADYLRQIRKVCDDRDLLMIVDETRLPAAISGNWFFYQAAEIRPDIVTASAGWTGGLPGGLIFVADSAHAAATHGTAAVGTTSAGAGDSLQSGSSGDDDSASDGEIGDKAQFFRSPAMPIGETDYPLLRAVIGATAHSIVAGGGPGQIAAAASEWDEAWQSFVDGFEFVSGCMTVGLWAVTRFDLPVVEVRRAAELHGLRWIESSDTTLLACLPMLNRASDGKGLSSPPEELFQKLRLTLETIERQTIES